MHPAFRIASLHLLHIAASSIQANITCEQRIGKVEIAAMALDSSNMMLQKQ